MADQFTYYEWGKFEKPLEPPQENQCSICAAVQMRADVAVLDTERDAQVAFKWGGLKMVNDAVAALWGPLWNTFQCTNKDCKIREACGNQPTYIKACVTDVTIQDPTAPQGVKQVWRLSIYVERKIKCVPPREGQREEDVTPEPFKDKLPEQPEPPRREAPLEQERSMPVEPAPEGPGKVDG